MPAVVYPYTILAGRRSPLIPLGLGYQGKWQRVQAYADSGAFYLPIRSINVQLPEFQAAYREPPPTPVVAGCPPVILTRVSGDVEYPHRRHS